LFCNNFGVLFNTVTNRGGGELRLWYTVGLFYRRCATKFDKLPPGWCHSARSAT